MGRHKGLGSLLMAGPRVSSPKRLNSQALAPQNTASEVKHLNLVKDGGAGDTYLHSPDLVTFSASK